MNASFVTSDRVTLNYRDEGSGCALLLVSGHTAPLESWQLVSDALLAAGYRVVAVDRRHTGASDFPAHGMRMARQGADLHELLAALDLGRVVAVGSSLGVSALWAMIDLFGTEQLRGLVCIDQTPKMVNEGSWDLGLYDLTWTNLDEFVNGFGVPDPAGRFMRPSAIAPDPAAMRLIAALSATPYPHAEVRPLLRDHAVQDWRDVLARIDVPTLAIGGRSSELWPVEHAAAIASAAPDGRLVVLEASGHVPMVTEPGALNRAIVDFVAAVSSS